MVWFDGELRQMVARRVKNCLFRVNELLFYTSTATASCSLGGRDSDSCFSCYHMGVWLKISYGSARWESGNESEQTLGIDPLTSRLNVIDQQGKRSDPLTLQQKLQMCGEIADGMAYLVMFW